jgi:hypothetical protein
LQNFSRLAKPFHPKALEEPGFQPRRKCSELINGVAESRAFQTLFPSRRIPSKSVSRLPEK